MINILYDIEVLGLSYVDERSRTGIYRVVKNIAEGILHSNEFNLLFSASNLYSSALLYLETNPTLAKIPLVYPKKWYVQVKEWEDKVADVEKRLGIAVAEDRAISADAYNLLRKIIYRTRKRIVASISKSSFDFSDIDIFHSPFYAIPALVQSQKKVKKILTIYDLIPILHPEYFIIEGEHPVKKAIDTMKMDGWAFTISQSTKDDLCNYRAEIHPDQVIVTHLAASPDIFYPSINSADTLFVRKKYNLSDKPYFLSLCTLEPRKNIDHVIRCFAKLLKEKQIQDVNLVLVGIKGWNFDKIFNEIESNKDIQSHIISTGFVDDKDLAVIYSEALGFIYTSFYEGFGLPPLEAMQCGIPVITSNTSSLPEVVGDAGLMVDPKDEDGLCQAMLEIYRDEILRKQMSQKSLQQASKFSWEKCVQDTINGYKMAMHT